jgi:alpha-tubulin suppressor-like RCC1 family protein
VSGVLSKNVKKLSQADEQFPQLRIRVRNESKVQRQSPKGVVDLVCWWNFHVYIIAFRRCRVYASDKSAENSSDLHYKISRPNSSGI